MPMLQELADRWPVLVKEPQAEEVLVGEEAPYQVLEHCEPAD